VQTADAACTGQLRETGQTCKNRAKPVRTATLANLTAHCYDIVETHRMNLDQLEARLQNLIELGLLRSMPGMHMEDVIIQKLAAAIQVSAITQVDGTRLAPDVFTLIVHPDTASHWQPQQLLDTIRQALEIVGQEAGLHFASAPTVAIATDDEVLPSDANVLASHRIDPTVDTKATTVESGDPSQASGVPENAFLIIEGVKVFPLAGQVTNVGRRLDNQLVIDDPRVSRNHAQLRVIKGRFVIFDLNSTGGTFVNGQRTSQSVLYAGDVISLAGVALIFGQDNPPPRPDLKDTSPFLTAGAERPTAILRDKSTGKLKKK